MDKKADSNSGQNEEAFSTNRGLGDAPNGEAQQKDTKRGGSVIVDREEAQEPKMEVEKSASADIDMADAPAKSPGFTAQKETAEASANTDDANAPAVAPTSPASGSPTSSAVSPKTKEDVIMGDAPAQPEPSVGPDRAESTQETTLSDVLPVTPTVPPNQPSAVPASSTTHAPHP